MKKIFKFLLNNWVILLLAVLIGVASSVPQYMGAKNSPNFQGIYHGVTDDEIYYEARARDVLDGHPNLANPYIYEHKDGSPMQFWLPDYILAKPIGWLGLSVPVGFIIWTGILTALLAVLSYVILYVLTGSKSWSILGMFFANVILSANTFLRLPSPAFNFVFWLLTFLFLLLYIKKKEKMYAVLSALSFGLLFHLYPYFWTFFVVLFAVFLVLVFVLKVKDMSYKTYLVVCLGAFVIGIPYFVSVWQSSNLSVYNESLRRLGMIATHFPSGFLSVGLAVIIICLFLYSYKKEKIVVSELSIFLFSAVLSAVIVINQHLLTGKNLEFSSHYLLGNLYTFVFVGAYVIYSWQNILSSKFKKIFFYIMMFLICVMSVYSVANMIKVEMTYSSYDIYTQNYAGVFDWLSKNAKPDEVVYTNDDIGFFLPIYTSQNVYYSGYGILFFMSGREVEERFIINHYFDNFTPAHIVQNQRMIFGGYYTDEYGHNQSKNKIRRILGLPQDNSPLVPQEQVIKVLADAVQMQKIDFAKIIKTYRVDYLVWDSNKNPNWVIPKTYKILYFSKGIYIYKII